MKSYMMEVSKKGILADGSTGYIKQGEVEIFYPLLSELGLAVEPKEYDEDGFPVYENDSINFVADAVMASIKAMARNRLQPGTATLKEGLSIAKTVQELTEKAVANTGDHLAATREFLADFKAWLPSTGKAEAVQASLYKAVKNRDSIMSMTAAKKQKIAEDYIAVFAEQLDADKAARYAKAMTAVVDACNSGDPLDDA